MSGNFNYAAPGSHVGIQARDVVISGGLVVNADGVSIQGQVTADDEPGED